MKILIIDKKLKDIKKEYKTPSVFLVSFLLSPTSCLNKASAKARDLEKKVEAAGGEDGADFYLLQECNIAQCDEQTNLSNIVKILGGFYAKDDPEGMSLLMGIYQENRKRNKLLEKRKELQVNFEHFDHEASVAESNKAAGYARKRDKLSDSISRLDASVAVLDQNIASLQEKLSAVTWTEIRLLSVCPTIRKDLFIIIARA